MHKLSVFYTFFVVVVIWSAIALNVTRKLDKINHFTSKRPGNLTAPNLTSISYHSRESSAGQDQIRNLSYSILSSQVSSVTSVVSSCSGQCSGVKQQPVFKRELKEGDRFAAFYKVHILISNQLVLSRTTSSEKRFRHGLWE